MEAGKGKEMGGTGITEGLSDRRGESGTVSGYEGFDEASGVIAFEWHRVYCRRYGIVAFFCQVAGNGMVVGCCGTGEGRGGKTQGSAQE